MNDKDAIEQAYKNGYQKGMEDAVKNGYAVALGEHEKAFTNDDIATLLAIIHLESIDILKELLYHVGYDEKIVQERIGEYGSVYMDLRTKGTDSK